MSEAVAEPLAAETDSPAKTNSSTENTDASKSSSGDTSRMPAPDLLRRQMAHCGEYTYQALNKIGKLSPEDTSRISQKYLKVINRTEKGETFQDALTFLVREGWKKQEIEARDVTLELTRALLRYSKTKISHLAFAHQNDTPIEFYNEFPAISEICRLLGCPVIQVSDKDFLTVTSINPFTATAAARLISNEIESECGRKPFHFITTTDLTAWKYTCERHFGT
ncbi:MAG: hypothetical protein HRU46_03135 [Verrucomicrobiales bacterium]|nr:hypothetical protein [Verrucomicrobiales bacterium]